MSNEDETLPEKMNLMMEKFKYKGFLFCYVSNYSTRKYLVIFIVWQCYTFIKWFLPTPLSSLITLSLPLEPFFPTWAHLKFSSSCLWRIEINYSFFLDTFKIILIFCFQVVFNFFYMPLLQTATLKLPTSAMCLLIIYLAIFMLLNDRWSKRNLKQNKKIEKQKEDQKNKNWWHGFGMEISCGGEKFGGRECLDTMKILYLHV